ncbi:MAG: hypothetical protein M0041_00140 [Nitrospiraceae bacterium]|nr:hypothetical protein [Nitrospiraceae bacterium]MDA8149536.1 hypothetical protein [Nitrospiraceae bacterium]
MGLFSFLKKAAPEKIVAQSEPLSDEKILKEAWKAGRYSPANSQCSPNYIDQWVLNNQATYQSVATHFFERFPVRQDLYKAVFLEMYRGFSDMVLAEPEIEHCAYRLENPEALKVARRIFEGVAGEYGISLN